MEKIIALSILVILLISLVVSIYILFRNDRVYEFRIMLTDLCCKINCDYLDSLEGKDYTDDRRKYKEYLSKMWDSISDISYEKMLYSIKPLKPEYWLNKEQLEFLKLKF